MHPGDGRLVANQRQASPAAASSPLSSGGLPSGGLRPKQFRHSLRVLLSSLSLLVRISPVLFSKSLSYASKRVLTLQVVLVACLVVAATIPLLFSITAWIESAELIFYEFIAHGLGRTTLETLGMTLLTVSTSLSLGAALAWCTTFIRIRGSAFIVGALYLPFFIPTALYGTVFQTAPFANARLLFCASQVIALYPIAYFLFRHFLHHFDRGQLEAARVLGARPSKVFARVLLPQGLPVVGLATLVIACESLTDLLLPRLFGINVLASVAQSTYENFEAPWSTLRISSFILLLPLFVLVACQAVFRKRHYLVDLHKTKRVESSVDRATGLGKGVALAFCWTTLGVVTLLPIGIAIAGAPYPGLNLELRPILVATLASFGSAGIVALIATFCAFQLLLVTRQTRLGRLTLPLSLCAYIVPQIAVAATVLTLTPKEFYLTSMTGLAISTTILSLHYFPLLFWLFLGVNLPKGAELTAESLGVRGIAQWRRIHFPALRNTFIYASIFVFVGVLKEIPGRVALLGDASDLSLSLGIYRAATAGHLPELGVYSLITLVLGAAYALIALQFIRERS